MDADDAQPDQLEQLRRFVDEWGEVAREVTEVVGDAVGRAYDDPVCLAGAPSEELRLEDLAVTINPAFSKLIVIFAHLTAEVARLHKAADETLFPTLVVFGERPNTDDTLFEGDPQAALAHALTKLQDVVLFLEQLTVVSRNLFAQLAALYGDVQRVYAPLQAVRLSTAFMALGDALGLAAGLDEAVSANHALPSAFAMFRRMLQTVQAAPCRFAVGEGGAELLEAALTTLENRLLSADSFNCTLDQFCRGEPPPQHFLDQLASSAFTSLTDISSRLSTEGERPSDRRNLVAVLSLVALHSRLAPRTPDKKLCKAAWDLHKRVLMMPVSSTVHLQPVEFLCNYLPPSAIALGPKEPLKAAAAVRAEALDKLDGSLMKELNGLLAQGVSWIARLESSLPTKSTNMSAVLGPRVRLLSNGMLVAQRLRNLLQVTIHLHVALEAPISKAQVRVLAQTAELLQAILSAYNRRRSEIVLEAPHLLGFALGRLASLVAPAREMLETAIATGTTGWGRVQDTLAGRGAGADAARQDAVAAASLAERVLSGPPTTQRLMLIRLCFDTLNDAFVLKDTAGADAAELIELTDMIANIDFHADAACDTSFLFFSRELLPSCLKDVYSRPEEAHRLPLLVAAFRASQKMLLRGNAMPELLEGFEEEMQLALDEEVIGPLCTDVETDLRLHIHSARLTGVVDVNPVQTGVRDLSQFLGVPPMRLLTKEVDIRSRVIHYLNSAFHNHTAVSLNNWKTYGEMRNLAMEKYRIPLAEIELPGQTLEQGLDVLEIMRNIHIFVARYNYNLNTQCFIERALNAKDRKHLNTISIRHVANSIRTHGTGITHTTINFVYQYLAQRFQVFSQFLFDDHIKSMLLKESRVFNAAAPTTKPSGRQEGGLGRNRAAAQVETPTPARQQQRYPVERALRFNRDIRKLGVSEDGSSFLDQFRLLITEIGNALGFVRMVRLGAMHYCTNAAKFVPDLSHASPDFEASTSAEGLSDGTVAASRCLDAELASLCSNSAEGTDYFKVLVDVFSTELCSENNAHLKEFYLLLPALTLSAVEFILHSKERLAKRGKEALTAAFTDDGFALGVAYVLRVLQQDVRFNSLNWYESVAEHYAEEMRIQAEASPSSSRWRSSTTGEEEQVNVELRLGRIKGTAAEMVLLKYNLVGARTFFSEAR
mmetsp:Transcript_7605/g.19370  ORF Transcript_7605/g.19370 Transcript_7605/m.19370 type:complete len:1168 (-) Transcript_7605:91-3594(-)